MVSDLASRVVRWQRTHGRHDLPWQNTRDPYRVWLSEIMLQQTQVLTVRDYFARFLAQFPNVRALAAAHLDEVLALWSGLGYYSRARNLHLCAQQVVSRHGGEFPHTAEILQTLPGIGRSTAAAVASLCFGERVAILDGNVKRVLTRFLGFEQDLAVLAHERALWTLATDLLPHRDLQQTMPRYTQGMMDLGATLCTRAKPVCEACPLSADCVARAQGQPGLYPVRTRKLKRSSQSLWLLWAQTRDGAIWLSQRPTPGVWAGLYCFVLYDSREALEAAVPARSRSALQDEPVFIHVLTHKDLYLHPVKVRLPASAKLHMEGAWYTAEQLPRMGLPAPVKKLLQV
ncbi:MAG: A/G-specific adenine glycosylase [Gammaproteobacteria bacterium]|nr:A/G-specific adenine glycosylase [Gammaproteobacteria bacterium]MBU0787696.1 A/G-specific adenine glycosylase [Gammaproteobacteria bacterium]MBU0814834.1 A/G-specific adenine glycosylase [Gammaproteobacteria bacterium]MBU1786058.1 A/G-specific adenine glycosylase [Gammaproteobacteria bacterium]